MTTIVVLVAAGLLTWLLRAWFLVAGDRPLAPALAKLVAPARIAVLGALIASGALAVLGEAGAGPDSLVMVAALAAGGVMALRRRSLVATMSAGMMVAWVGTALVAL